MDKASVFEEKIVKEYDTRIMIWVLKIILELKGQKKN